MVSSAIRFLAGAPEASQLDWSDEILTKDFALQIQRYLGIDHAVPATTSTQAWSDWRAVPLNEQIFYQSPVVRKSHDVSHPGRLRNAAIHVLLDGDEDFLDHSFAVYADIQSSQLAPQLTVDEDEPTFLSENTELSTFLEESTVFPAEESPLSSRVAPTPSADEAAYSHFRGPIMSIKAIPDATHLARIQPQTMTVNLVAGVISISPTRTVNVRRGNYDMEIVELVLGDDTKAGFTISSWHTPLQTRPEADELRQTLRALRPQDIVLVERLALSSFRGQVFGQSLNRRATKNATNITVLCRSEAIRSAGTYDGSSVPLQLAAKLQRVKDWVASFIGPGYRGGGRAHPGRDLDQHSMRKRKHADDEQEEYLPPDSQV